MLKLDEPFRNHEILIISLFTIVQICGWRVKQCFLLKILVDILPLDPDPWIRIFLRIRIQELKILRIQRIRILSTVLKGTKNRGDDFKENIY